MRNCMSFHGRVNLFETQPRIAVEHNALYMPTHGADNSQGRAAGLYDVKGKLILEAARFRGPEPHSIGSPFSTWFDPKRAKNIWSEPAFYMGQFAKHYGHFLVDSLCRLWAYQKNESRKIKIIYHGTEMASEFFKIDYMRNILNAMGLAEVDFIKFDEPTLISKIIVPEPAFEELSYVYKEFATFFNSLGNIIAPADENTIVSDRPIYLTKINIKSGISHFVNEDEFANVLSNAGVEVISPELLSLEEQIKIFRTRSVITGLTGSAFHTSIFVPRRNYLCLNYHDTIWSNQLLFDRANENVGFHVCPDNDSPNSGTDANFGNNFHIENPKKLAEEFLRAIDDFQFWLTGTQYVSSYRNIPQLQLRGSPTGHQPQPESVHELSLDEIGKLTGTDKSSKAHGYLKFYDRFVREIRVSADKVLEIGVLNGQSLQMWGTYFTNATIVGLDINPETLKYSKGRLKVIMADQSRSADLEAVAEEHGPFDLIVDDGSHIWEHQMNSFTSLFESVKSGGFYIIEDLQVCFPEIVGYEHYRQGRDFSMVNFLEKLSNYVVRGCVPESEVDVRYGAIMPKLEFVAFHYGTVLLKKK